MITTRELPAFPPGNPFHHDHYRMGIAVGQNVTVMFDHHDHEHQEFIIVHNTETGERILVQFSQEIRTMTSLDNPL